MRATARMKEIIPHRPPALLVDDVEEVEPGHRVVTRKAVSLSEPCYRAQESEAYPLGLLLESWAQSALLLACWERPVADIHDGTVALLAGVRDARVLAPVLPGTVVRHEIHVVRDLGDTVITAGGSTVEGEPVLEVGQLTLALRDLAPAAPAAPAAIASDRRS